MQQIPHLNQILSAYGWDAHLMDVSNLNTGHINDTFKLSYKNNAYLLQAINTAVFKTPVALMRNMEQVCSHLQKAKVQGRYSIEPLKLHYTVDNNSFVADSTGRYWRLMDFVSPSKTYLKLEDVSLAKEAALAYAEFIFLLAELNPNDFSETIPKFHNLPNRIKSLEEAIQIDAVGRVAEVQKEIEWARSFYSIADDFVERTSSGLPLRILHNDAKLANILFEADSYKAKAVVDLDTVMPGYVMYDFGDMVRSFCSPVQEDATELEKIHLQKKIFEAIVDGFATHLGDFLHQDEIQSLILGAKYMIFIMAVRFLTDYIMGDVYYKIHRPKHNLHRCQNQLTLLKDVVSQQEELKNIVNTYFNKP